MTKKTSIDTQAALKLKYKFMIYLFKNKQIYLYI